MLHVPRVGPLMLARVLYRMICFDTLLSLLPGACSPLPIPIRLCLSRWVSYLTGSATCVFKQCSQKRRLQPRFSHAIIEDARFTLMC